MRLVKLVVERFQCIERAEVELGPHLNVLYGPNDLGKSSLAWAIRAVLLVPHGSTHAARFASWYGDGEPRVQLTLCADDGRYWRVTKSFAAAGGRSALESSKDGRVFTAEANGREVDRRVREMLGWGLPAPGAQGRQAFPDSFLTQVLLADQAQDSVRKVLFEARIDRDPDESGRERLNAALGALAQDPLFKQVLDASTVYVDRAFTPRGQRRRAAGSPWVEVAERITALKDEQDALVKAVQDSAGVERRLQDVRVARDELASRVAEIIDQLEVARAQLAARREREALYVQVQERAAKVREVEQAAAGLAAAEAQLRVLDQQAAAAASEAERLARAVAEADVAAQSARARLDALAHAPDAAREVEALQARLRAAEEDARAADAGAAMAVSALRAAETAATQLATADVTSREATERAAGADAALAEARAGVDRARQALDDARQRQRDARSGDRVQARELRRHELDNRALVLASHRAEREAVMQRAREAGALARAAAEADEAVARARSEVDAARAAVATAESGLARAEHGRTGLAQVEAYGRYRALRDQLASATKASEDAARERARAEDLRRAAEELRAQVRPALPPPDRIAALRALHDELRVAEAALGGGLSIVLRPRRPVTVRATRDGAVDAPVTVSEPLTLAATRRLALDLDEVGELEVIAGEEAARARAAELRARWVRDGEAALVEHGAASIDELAGLRARSDDAARRIADHVRDADIADQRAAAVALVELAALREQHAAAEAELGAADREELALGLARLGEPWQAGLRRRAGELDAEVAARRASLDAARAEVARTEAHHDALRADAARRHTDAAAAQATLDAPWAEVVATARAALQQLATDLADVERERATLASGASQAEAAVDAAVASAQAGLAAAAERQRLAEEAAGVARVAQVQAATRLDAARSAARQLDVAGAWRADLDAGARSLPLTTWHETVRAAERAREVAAAAVAGARQDVEAARAAHAAAIADLRVRAQAADEAARDARARATAAATACDAARADHAAAVVAHADQRVAVASVNLDEHRAEIARLRARMLELEPAMGDVEPDTVELLERSLARGRDELRDLDDELARARGALEQVGGNIVRERLAEIGQALDRALQRERELEIECEAWRLLQTTLRETETTESAHLGRALAGPVSERFRALTAGRYGDLELGAQLEAGGVLVAGERRDLAALSAGTQDQLATLLRVCIAEQLRSAIVLDDHLSQSDTSRLAWFNELLRQASADVQIVLITCRPQELLADDERPAAGQPLRDTARVRAIDLSQIIRRFAPAARPRQGAASP